MEEAREKVDQHLRKTSAHLTYSLTKRWRTAIQAWLGIMMKGKQESTTSHG